MSNSNTELLQACATANKLYVDTLGILNERLSQRLNSDEFHIVYMSEDQVFFIINSITQNETRWDEDDLPKDMEHLNRVDMEQKTDTDNH